MALPPHMQQSSTIPPPTGSPAPLYRRKPLRVACVQFDVKLGRVKENSAKVEAMTSGLRPGMIDLLVLPEMCLSGYVFTSPTAILPYLEPPRIGPTSLLARSLAQRLKCHVVAGYPEALPSTSSSSTSSDPSSSNRLTVPDSSGRLSRASSSSSNEGDVSGLTLADGSMDVDTADEPAGDDLEAGNEDAEEATADAGPKAMKELEGEGVGVGYNSAVLVGPKGDVLGNYRKTFRFETDKCWARDGDGFTHFDLPEPLGRTAVAICMDLNPRDFVAPWDAFELATYVRDNSVDTLVLPMNWLQPPAEPPETAEPIDPAAPLESTLNYWAARLQPLHDPTPGYGSPAVGADPTKGKEVVFITCNRVGEEEGTKFVGTSCVMTVSSSPSRIELVEVCNVSEERVMLATVA